MIKLAPMEAPHSAHFFRAERDFWWNLDHIEVWDRGRWEQDQESLDSEIVGIAESLGHPS